MNTATQQKPARQQQHSQHTPKEAEVEADKALTTQPAGALSAPIDYAQDAGAGMEGVDKDSHAIPFLVVLQPLSPVVVDRKVEGAAAGLLMNSVTQEFYPEAWVVPCAFQRRWIRWGARESGGGFKGEFTPAQAQEIVSKGEVKMLENRYYYPLPDGSINEKKSDRLTDTRSHYILVLREPKDELFQPMVFALASTGIKVSKNFVARMESLKLRNPNSGALYIPPSFSHMYPVKTEQKRNDAGTWFLPVIGAAQRVENMALYSAAKAFHAQVIEGKVTAAVDSLHEGGEESAGASDGGQGGF